MGFNLGLHDLIVHQFCRLVGHGGSILTETASRSYVIRISKGQLVHSTEETVKPNPLSDLDRLRLQGIISEEEYQRKKMELESRKNR